MRLIFPQESVTSQYFNDFFKQRYQKNFMRCVLYLLSKIESIPKAIQMEKWILWCLWGTFSAAFWGQFHKHQAPAF